jgi:hypothetical protein
MPEVRRWHLELSDEVIAKIDANEFAFPFTYCWLIDSPALERFRKYFTDDTQWADDDQELEELCGEVQDKGGFSLREMPSCVAYQGVCLNHDGSRVVWFRHGDPL